MLMYTDCIGIPPELSESAIVLAKAIIIISIVTPGFLHTVEGVVQSNGSLARTYLLAGINLAAMWLVDRLTHRSYIHHDAGGYLLYAAALATTSMFGTLMFAFSLLRSAAGGRNTKDGTNEDV